MRWGMLLGAALLASAVTATAQAQSDPPPFEQRYNEAISIGLTEFGDRDYDAAGDAFSRALALAETAGEARNFERGKAHALRAIAISAASFRRSRVSAGPASDAFSDFAQARTLLYPLAAVDAPDGSLTPAQEIYAQTLAWDGALRTRMRLGGHTIPEAFRAGDSARAYIVASPDDPPDCSISMHRPAPHYPAAAMFDGMSGTVIVRLRFNERGEAISIDAPIGLGTPSYLAAVRAVLSDWTASFDTTRPPGCRVPPVYFVRVSFVS
jgi:hypothetical protein